MPETNQSEDLLPISVIFLTHNEEQNIERSLRSVAGWASEVFVVDSGSTDRTLEIAQQYVDQIVHHNFDNYAQQRNWAQSNLTLNNDWIFHIDADEWVTPELRDSLAAFFASDHVDETNGVLIRRRTEFMGRWIKHGGHYPSYHLRIYRHQRGRCEERKYDQHFVVEGKTHRLDHGDLVDPVMADLDSWTMRHIKWANLEMEELHASQPHSVTGIAVTPRLTGNLIERRRWARTSIYNRLPLFLRAIGYFLFRYFIRLGFLDGREGLIFHFLQGFWFRFYIDAKLWEKQRGT